MPSADVDLGSVVYLWAELSDSQRAVVALPLMRGDASEADTAAIDAARGALISELALSFPGGYAALLVSPAEVLAEEVARIDDVDEMVLFAMFAAWTAVHGSRTMAALARVLRLPSTSLFDVFDPEAAPPSDERLGDALAAVRDEAPGEPIEQILSFLGAGPSPFWPFWGGLSNSLGGVGLSGRVRRQRQRAPTRFDDAAELAALRAVESELANDFRRLSTPLPAKTLEAFVGTLGGPSTSSHVIQGAGLRGENDGVPSKREPRAWFLCGALLGHHAVGASKALSFIERHHKDLRRIAEPPFPAAVDVGAVLLGPGAVRLLDAAVCARRDGRFAARWPVLVWRTPRAVPPMPQGERTAAKRIRGCGSGKPHCAVNRAARDPQPEARGYGHLQRGPAERHTDSPAVARSPENRRPNALREPLLGARWPDAGGAAVSRWLDRRTPRVRYALERAMVVFEDRRYDRKRGRCDGTTTRGAQELERGAASTRHRSAALHGLPHPDRGTR